MALESAKDAIKKATRRINVMGLGATGKTTFSISASPHAGDKIGQHAKGAPVECKDTVVFAGDNDGIKGAEDAGLLPALVSDLSHHDTWNSYKQQLENDLTDLLPMVRDGRIKYVVIDMALPNRLITEHVNPQTAAEWGKVPVIGLELFRALGALKGATIITNVQLKALTVMESRNNPDAAITQAAALDVISGGGERNTFGADLAKGIYKIFHENASYTFTREAKRVRDPMKKENGVSMKFITHCMANGRFDAKSRSLNALPPSLPGERTLHSILKEIYGENL